MMRLLYTIVLCLVLIPFSQGQEVQYVEVGINGLHCSACSFTVEKALKKVDGVSVVQMNLNERTGKVYFTDEQEIDFPVLAKAIKNAGYSMRFLKIHLKKEWPVAEQCELWNYCLTDSSKKTNSFQLFGEEYLPKKVWKNWKAKLPSRMCTTCEAPTFVRPI